MNSTTITVDRELVHSSFRDWQAEQAVLDAQLLDSVAALEAYQSHLDGWQRELARERDELERLREELDREKVVDGNQHDKNQQLEQDLSRCARENHVAYDGAPGPNGGAAATRSRRAEVNTELAVARSREKDLSSALEALQKSSDLQRLQWEAAIVEMRQQLEQSLEFAAVEAAAQAPVEANASDPQVGPTTSANPVLGSLMEQFDKLRQQRSVGRLSHPRTR